LVSEFVVQELLEESGRVISSWNVYEASKHSWMTVNTWFMNVVLSLLQARGSAQGDTPMLALLMALVGGRACL